jgi:hypothetical protein
VKKNQIFISYSHKDIIQANLIAGSLSKLGWNVWKDQRLTVGEDFSDEILNALKDASLVVIIWSGSSVKSDWVKKEASLAIENDKYFPIRIEYVNLPKGFENFHTESLFRWSGEIDEEQFSSIYLQIFEKIPVRNNETEKLIEKARLRRDFFFNSAGIWNDLADGITERTEVKWPFWMVRYIVADNQESLDDLIWSVGGSPPYGNVDYDEAEAVYELVEGFMGAGRSKEKLYAKVEKFIINKPLEFKAIEAFRIYDRVASNSEGYTLNDLRIGNEEAVNVVDEPLNSYFNLLKAQLMYNSGNLVEAYDLADKSVNPLLRFAQSDKVYLNRLSQALTNTAIFATLNGDLAEARRCAFELKKIEKTSMLANFEDLLLNEPDFSAINSVDEIEETAWDFMQNKSLPHYAIEWYKEAEKRYRVQGNYKKLSGLLGDMAVCYRRLGNIQMCIKLNRLAIEESQKSKETLSIYRWCQNLAGILMRAKDYEGAFPYLRLSLYTSAQLAEPNEIKLSASALFDYHAYNLCTSQDIKDMYRTALEMIDQTANNARVYESMAILTDFINDKPHFATM